MNAQKAFMVAIAAPTVSTQKVHTIAPANQDFMEMGRGHVNVSNNYLPEMFRDSIKSNFIINSVSCKEHLQTFSKTYCFRKLLSRTMSIE